MRMASPSETRSTPVLRYAPKPARRADAAHGVRGDTGEECAPPRGRLTEIGPGFIRIPATSPGGFDITLLSADGGHVLFLGGWHDEFADLDLALTYVRLALSGDLRLEVEVIGAKASSWSLQRRRADGSWQEESLCATAFGTFWRRRRTVIQLRNGAGHAASTAPAGLH